MYKGIELKEYPESLNILQDVEPVYEELPGWKTDISGCKSYDELPEKCPLLCRTNQPTCRGSSGNCFSWSRPVSDDCVARRILRMQKHLLQDGTKYAAGKRCFYYFYYSSPQALQPLQEPLQELHPPCNERRPAKAVKVLRGLIMRPGETVTPISSDCREVEFRFVVTRGNHLRPGKIRQAVFNSSRDT